MRCIEAFDIDDGEMESVPPVRAFVLGVEWQMVANQLDHEHDQFSRMIHAENANRYLRMCIRRGRTCKIVKIGDAKESGGITSLWQMDVGPGTGQSLEQMLTPEPTE